MKSRLLAVATAIGLSLMASAANAVPLSVTWQSEGPVTNTGNADNFDDGTIMFAGFAADQLLSITSPGYYHNHGTGGITFDLDIFLDGVWTNIFTDTPASNAGNIALSSIATPIPFSAGVVSGLRLLTTQNVSQAYHISGGNTVFTFNTFNQVPEPGTLALFGLGLIGLGFARRKRAD